jgi:anti-sigma factor RsiW
MICPSTEQVSEYLDESLAPDARLRFEVHLAECAECAQLEAQLRAVKHWARSYQPAGPPRDLWEGVRAAIELQKVVALPPRSPAPGRWAARHLVAAAIGALVLGGAGWLVLRRPAVAPVAVAPSAPSIVRQAGGLPAAEADYTAAVHDLEQVLAQGRGKLDSSTVRIVEQSLATIDRAILEARAAIQRDSANGYLNVQIAANMRRKLALLRAATRAIATQS